MTLVGLILVDWTTLHIEKAKAMDLHHGKGYGQPPTMLYIDPSLLTRFLFLLHGFQTLFDAFLGENILVELLTIYMHPRRYQ